MITFSLSPRRRSTLPLIAASVNTRVVSWNDAADSHDVVFSAALMRPSRTVCAVAGSPPQLRPDADAVRDHVLADLLVHGGHGDLLLAHPHRAGVAGAEDRPVPVAAQLLALHDLLAVLDQDLHAGLHRIGHVELLARR